MIDAKLRRLDEAAHKLRLARVIHEGHLDYLVALTRTPNAKIDMERAINNEARTRLDLIDAERTHAHCQARAMYRLVGG